MDYILKLVFIVLMLPGLALADTYPSVSGYKFTTVPRLTFSLACLDVGTSGYPIAFGPTHLASNGNQACVTPWTAPISDPIQTGDIRATQTINQVVYCPSGGTVSGGSCINAPSCVAPQVRATTSPYACRTIATCIYPEADNGSGVCAVPPECSTGKQFKYSAASCETPPACASTETFNAYTWACELKKLYCPGHTHSNTANDACLADAPLACSAGMHDDGTYTCVANDAQACTSAQTSGTIFGVHQCVNKPNVAQFKKDAQDALTNKNAKTLEKQQKLAASRAADAAAAANPGDTGLAAAASSAKTALTVAGDALDAADAEFDSKMGASTLATSGAVADAAEKSEQTDKTDREEGASYISSLVAETGLSDSYNFTAPTEGGNYGSCPAPQTISTSHGTITMSLQPYCDLATGVRPLVLALFWLSSAFIVYGSIKD